jgi:hypothetical protein
MSSCDYWQHAASNSAFIDLGNARAQFRAFCSWQNDATSCSRRFTQDRTLLTVPSICENIKECLGCWLSPFESFLVQSLGKVCKVLLGLTAAPGRMFKAAFNEHSHRSASPLNKFAKS